MYCVDRPTAQQACQAALAVWLAAPEQADLVAKIRTELKGKILACLCKVGTPCHGDLLARLANEEVP
jgi:hypothetical protein